MLAHHAFRARALAAADRLDDGAVLLLRDDEDARAPAGPVLRARTKPFGDANGSAAARSTWRRTMSLPAMSASSAWNSALCST